MLLDPYEVFHLKAKPVETIERFTRSTAVAARMEKAEKKNTTFQKRTMETNDYIKEHFYMRKKHKTIKGTIGLQTDALYRFIIAASKRRAEAKRKRAARGAKPLVEVNHNGDEIDDGIFQCDDDDDCDDGDGGLVQIGPVDIENIPPDNKETAPDEKKENPLPRRPTIETLLFGDFDDDDLDNSINVESLYGGCESIGQTHPMDENQAAAYTLLEILHKHMLKFWSAAEELTSDLHVRVQEWEDTMLPILEEEEVRKEFDIHEYGNELLAMFREVGEVKTINELLAGRQGYEFSRYVLACLMMANTYNVRVEGDVRVDDKGRRSSTIKVTLLKKDRHHEIFDKEGAL
ncbi:hypothetical protein KIN20_007074 [Parelaphostrongylus tenuis]|uniref:Condensin-2 complex subunit H2 C-terminal domain-containing protein n=1 Tax=Parelaphostrongylus tenuis TaxID=148309 RepID=A0AAD5MP21_PARTN|nr:hypothetical protein KIN20_007074 [Parelaphostrongylus tenuis]